MLSPDEVIFKVYRFAETAHKQQLRKYSGEPYIVHPKRVMELCGRYTDDVAIHCGALLHDVLEDTSVTHAQLENFLRSVMDEATAMRTAKIVDELTDRFIKENYPRLNRRVRRQKEADRLSQVSGDAQTIKYADIIDNTDITENEPDFAKVYLREALNILEVMDKGIADLRERAIEQVNTCLNKLASYPQIR